MVKNHLVKVSPDGLNICGHEKGVNRDKQGVNIHEEGASRQHWKRENQRRSECSKTHFGLEILKSNNFFFKIADCKGI